MNRSENMPPLFSLLYCTILVHVIASTRKSLKEVHNMGTELEELYHKASGK